MSDLAKLEKAIAEGTTPDRMAMHTHWGFVICDRGAWSWRDYGDQTLTFDVGGGVTVSRTAKQAAEDVLRPA